MTSQAETNLAWDLIEVAGPHLDPIRRAAVCTKIGAGDTHSALSEMLRSSEAAGIRFPAALTGRLAAWLDCYVGSDDEPGLRTLVQRCGPT
jgi:hypothetical protein